MIFQSHDSPKAAACIIPSRDSRANAFKSYFDCVSFGLHGLVADEEVEVLDTFGEPPAGLVANLGRFFDCDRRRHDELRLLVAGIAELRVPVGKMLTL